MWCAAALGAGPGAERPDAQHLRHRRRVLQRPHWSQHSHPGEVIIMWEAECGAASQYAAGKSIEVEAPQHACLSWLPRCCGYFCYQELEKARMQIVPFGCCRINGLRPGASSATGGAACELQSGLSRLRSSRHVRRRGAACAAAVADHPPWGGRELSQRAAVAAVSHDSGLLCTAMRPLSPIIILPPFLIRKYAQSAVLTATTLLCIFWKAYFCTAHGVTGQKEMSG